MTDSFDVLQRRLSAVGQEHVLRFWAELDARQRAGLAAQIESLDLELLRRLQAAEDLATDWDALLAGAQPPPAYRLSAASPSIDRRQAIEAAETAIRAGQLGAVLVAGGQGTRLGFPHPKGMYRIGPVSGRSLFQMHVEQLLAVGRRYGVRIPLYLMTSPATHDETLQYFAEHDRFGLSADDLLIFCQGTMPALDARGKLLLAERDQIFLSPDGHGGMLAALQRTGGLRHAAERGLEHLFYFQVDNPLVSICDRELIGFHLLAESDLSTLVVAKTLPTEKVGNVVSRDGRLMVVEYSDLPNAVAERREPDGRLTFWAGNTAVHVMRRAFLEQMCVGEQCLPFHRALKQIPFIDEQGRQQTPVEPNGTKFERFIFDLLPSARNAIVVEGEAVEVFSPLKNASGAATDTPETTRRAIVDRARRWLTAAGCQVSEQVQVELSPRFALDAAAVPPAVRGRRITHDLYVESTDF